jgi:hypothetical protein
MDTHFLDQALANYRAETGDRRPWEKLPPSVQSEIIMAAQQLKRAGPLTIDEVLQRTSVTSSQGPVVGTSKWRLL